KIRRLDADIGAVGGAQRFQETQCALHALRFGVRTWGGEKSGEVAHGERSVSEPPCAAMIAQIRRLCSAAYAWLPCACGTKTPAEAENPPESRGTFLTCFG